MSRRKLRVAIALACVVALLACAAIAFARPGGGDSYNGGGDGGGGGGGGGGGDGVGLIFVFLIRLAIDYPYIGVPLLIGFVGFLLWRSKTKKGRQWTAGAAAPRPMQRREAPARAANISQGFDRIRADDANFSQVLLEDFLYALYAATHEARGHGQLSAMQAYFAGDALSRFVAAPGLTAVKGIIVGAMRFDRANVGNEGSVGLPNEPRRGLGRSPSEGSVGLPNEPRRGLGRSPSEGSVGLPNEPRRGLGRSPSEGSVGLPNEPRQGLGRSPSEGNAHLRVTFESNYVEVQGGREQTYYAEESWGLFRKRGVLSRTPDRARNVACPKCGAPLQAISIQGGTCTFCKTRVNGGDFDWVVRDVTIVRREPRPPQLTSESPEIGTDWPTVIDPRAREQFRELCGQDPAFAWPSFEGRVKLIHKTLNEGWSALDWLRVRPFVTDNLFQMQMYWIDAYKQAHLRNVLERARVAKVEAAKIVFDKFFVAFTVRVFATGLDYVMDERGGKVLRGSDTEERPYSEYWTLIRSAQTRGAGRSDPACPRCGAGLKVNMAGTCEYCHAKVTTGEFDWVLSRIEQDESYTG